MQERSKYDGRAGEGSDQCGVDRDRPIEFVKRDHQATINNDLQEFHNHVRLRGTTCHTLQILPLMEGG